mgnify:CR=1 FL=1
MNTSMSLETVTVADAATQRLRESLFAGGFAAGEEIKDTQIAAAYGIARPTARVAVQQLINEGILVRPPGFSARVRTFDAAQVRDLYRVRRLIELDAVREIVRSHSPIAGVASALEGFADLQGGDDDWSQIAAADVAFHTAVVDAAGSPRLQQFFSGITSEIRLLIALLRDQYTGGDALYQEHETLYRLLDGATPHMEVEAAWSDHLESAERFLVQHLS